MWRCRSAVLSLWWRLTATKLEDVESQFRPDRKSSNAPIEKASFALGIALEPAPMLERLPSADAAYNLFTTHWAPLAGRPSSRRPVGLGSG